MKAYSYEYRREYWFEDRVGKSRFAAANRWFAFSSLQVWHRLLIVYLGEKLLEFIRNFWNYLVEVEIPV